MKAFASLSVLICTVLVAGVSNAGAVNQTRSDELRSLTQGHIATLDKDLPLQSSFYTASTRFRDPTSSLFGPAWNVTGGEQIIEFFRAASEDSGTLEVAYNITNLFVEGDYVLANITSTVTACGVGLGLPQKVFTGDIHMVMVLEFEGDKIHQRTDYVGYTAAFEELEVIKRNLASEDDDPRCALTSE